MIQIAVLLTCYNRRQKTETCLHSFFTAIRDVRGYSFTVFLTDDGSTDGTSDSIKRLFPHVQVIAGQGNLFWAGGMRLAWNKALHSGLSFDAYLLINDDVEFLPFFWESILSTQTYALKTYAKEGIYVSSTKDKETGTLTYGGHGLQNHIFRHRTFPVEPCTQPKECRLANANILFVPRTVADQLGVLDARFTHSLADFDYTLTASQRGIPVLVTPGFGGYCANDHPEDVLSASLSRAQRIQNLYSHKGLVLNEYLYYLRKHFCFKAPYAFIVLWAKALFRNC